MTSTPNYFKQESKDHYRTAVNHYLSPKRKDSVKTKWENPFSLKVIANAIKKLEEKYSPKSLQVMDFGCGIGEGFVLAQNALKYLDILQTKELFYLGLDNSSEMVKVAKQKWENNKNLNFQEADIRLGIPDNPTEIYLSCGVPYSHLTEAETQDVLGHIFRAIKKNKTQSLIVIDVLGRYSIEWVSQWEHSRWAYRMSFLAEAQEQEDMMMSCHYAHDLKSMVVQASKQENCQIQDIEFFDRSVMVGRHTSTREYNSAIPPYREIINSLYESGHTTNFRELLFQSPSAQAPSPVKEFFESFSRIWNQVVIEAAEFCGENLNIPNNNIPLPESVTGLKNELSNLQESYCEHNFRTDIVEPTLAEYLHRLESTMQPGLGVGHTLIAIVYVDGTQ